MIIYKRGLSDGQGTIMQQSLTIKQIHKDKYNSKCTKANIIAI